jgi:transcription antitermination factor NusG
MNENWYIIYTREGWEKEVFQSLTRKKIRTFFPVSGTNVTTTDSKKILGDPLFKSYVFVQVKETVLESLRRITGVLNIVFWLDKPISIPNAEMETIINFMTMYHITKKEKCAININCPSSTVRCDATGNEISDTEKSYIKFTVPYLGYSFLAAGTNSTVTTIVKEKNKNVVKRTRPVQQTVSLLPVEQ